MPYDPEIRLFSRAFKFVDRFAPGDDITRSDLDIAFDDLVTGIKAMLQNGMDFIGVWDPASGFPTEHSDGTPVRARDFWQVAAAGTVDGVDFAVDDYLVALVDEPEPSYDGNWLRLPPSISAEMMEALGRAETAADSSKADADRAASYAGETPYLRHIRERDADEANAFSLPDLLARMQRFIVIPPAVDPGFDPFRGLSAQGRQNVRNALSRLRQLSLIRWTPAAPFPRNRSAMDGDGTPLYFPAGVQRIGVPYASLQDYGDLPGLEVNLRAFRDAVRNPDSVLYTHELFHGDGGGRAFYGANCSGFIAWAFNWPHYQATHRLAAAWREIGFVASHQHPTWEPEIVAIGDIVVTTAAELDSRHVEIVSNVTPTHITLFDESYNGPGETTLPYAAFLERCRARKYDLLKWKWDDVLIPYEPNPDSPLPGEDIVVPPLNPVVTVDRGDSAVYCPEHNVGPAGLGGAVVAIPDVTFCIMTEVQRLVVLRDGVEVTNIETAGNTTIPVHYTTAGNYTYHCVMPDESLSPSGSFAVARITATASPLTVAVGEPITVNFTAENCVPLYFSPGTGADDAVDWRLLTPAEVAAGSFTLTRTVPGAIRIVVSAKHPNGVIYNHPRLNPATRVVVT